MATNASGVGQSQSQSGKPPSMKGFTWTWATEMLVQVFVDQCHRIGCRIWWPWLLPSPLLSWSWATPLWACSVLFCPPPSQLCLPLHLPTFMSWGTTIHQCCSMQLHALPVFMTIVTQVMLAGYTFHQHTAPLGLGCYLAQLWAREWAAEESLLPPPSQQLSWDCRGEMKNTLAAVIAKALRITSLRRDHCIASMQAGTPG